MLVDLDATSPLRLTADITAAVALLEETGAASVTITGCRSRHSPYFNLVEQGKDDAVSLCKPPATPTGRRQDVPPTFDMNASIYIWQVERFRAEPKVFYPGTRLYEMPPERSCRY